MKFFLSFLFTFLGLLYFNNQAGAYTTVTCNNYGMNYGLQEPTAMYGNNSDTINVSVPKGETPPGEINSSTYDFNKYGIVSTYKTNFSEYQINNLYYSLGYSKEGSYNSSVCVSMEPVQFYAYAGMPLYDVYLYRYNTSTKKMVLESKVPDDELDLSQALRLNNESYKITGYSIHPDIDNIYTHFDNVVYGEIGNIYTVDYMFSGYPGSEYINNELQSYPLTFQISYDGVNYSNYDSINYNNGSFLSGNPFSLDTTKMSIGNNKLYFRGYFPTLNSYTSVITKNVTVNAPVNPTINNINIDTNNKKITADIGIPEGQRINVRISIDGNYIDSTNLSPYTASTFTVTIPDQYLANGEHTVNVQANGQSIYSSVSSSTTYNIAPPQTALLNSGVPELNQVDSIDTYNWYGNLFSDVITLSFFGNGNGKIQDNLVVQYSLDGNNWTSFITHVIEGDNTPYSLNGIISGNELKIGNNTIYYRVINDTTGKISNIITKTINKITPLPNSSNVNIDTNSKKITGKFNFNYDKETIGITVKVLIDNQLVKSDLIYMGGSILSEGFNYDIPNEYLTTGNHRIDINYETVYGGVQLESYNYGIGNTLDVPFLTINSGALFTPSNLVDVDISGSNAAQYCIQESGDYNQCTWSSIKPNTFTFNN